MNHTFDQTADAPRSSPGAITETQKLVWTIRRELWENRSVIIAPVSVAALVLVVALASTFVLPMRIRNIDSVPAAKQHGVFVRPVCIPPGPIMATTFLVAIFYCVDALAGERRDRSILFWKSLPVSDRTTLFAKAMVPVAILPAIGWILSVISVFILLWAGSAALLVTGVGVEGLWREVAFPQRVVAMLYGLLIHVLWFAPIYAWLLFVSSWARRAALLWAVLPIAAIAWVERYAFDTTWFGSLVKYRLLGAMTEGFTVNAMRVDVRLLKHLDPWRFLTSGGLWAGLAVAAILFTIAVRIRRNREPS
jgi:ABC-2 type transport system permease protein